MADLSLILGLLGRSPREGKGYPLQYSGLESYDWVTFIFILLTYCFLFSFTLGFNYPKVVYTICDIILFLKYSVHLKWMDGRISNGMNLGEGPQSMMGRTDDGGSESWALVNSCMPGCYITSVVSDSLQPYRLQPTRLLCPWSSPGKNTGVSCHAFLQGIFPT